MISWRILENKSCVGSIGEHSHNDFALRILEIKLAQIKFTLLMKRLLQEELGR
jgi:hypothetical protein